MKTDWTAEEIKQLRLAMGLNQTAFSERLGAGRQQQVSSWECGTKPQKAMRILLGHLCDTWEKTQDQKQAGA